MSDTLLAAKLYIPRNEHRTMARPTLLEMLETGARQPLTLVSGPAGSGKSTLLSAWAHATARDIAWISLDRYDNDPSRFLNYLIGSLQTIQPDLGQAAFTEYQASRTSLERVAEALIHELSGSPHTISLVLDDYHLIVEQAVHDFIAFLLDYLPAQLRLVLTSRHEPPLPLARLRVSGDLTEIRAEHLSFGIEEIEQYLTEIMQVELTTTEIVELDTRIEGWVAGLQMAALALRQHPDHAVFLRGLSGARRPIADYLAEEVFRGQAQDLRRFLLQTSILDRFNQPLCQAVTGQPESGRLLQTLEQANLFLVPLDDEQQWYRYHHLFADFLKNHLATTQPEEVKVLHARAAAWLAEQGYVIEAIQHALAAQEWVRAADLIEQTLGQFLSNGERQSLLSAIRALPAKLLHTRPRLLTAQAWASPASVADVEVERLLEDAEAALLLQMGVEQEADIWSLAVPPDVDGLLGEIAALRAVRACARGDMALTTHQIEAALERLPEENLTWRGIVAQHLGYISVASGKLSAAAHAFAEAATIGERSRHIANLLIALASLGGIQVTRGDLHQARATFERGLTYVEDSVPGSVPIVSEMYAGLALIYYVWNDLESAQEALDKAFELSSRTGGRQSGTINLFITAAYLFNAQGQTEEALQLLGETVDDLQTLYIRDSQWFVGARAYQARLWLEIGDLAAVEAWAAERQLASDDEIDPLREIEYITFTRLLITQGNYEAAGSLLERLYDQATTVGRTGHALTGALLLARLHHRLDDDEQALSWLKEALTIGEASGRIRPFLDEGHVVADLLERVTHTGTQSGFAAELLRVFRQTTSHPMHNNPLTDREQEVLVLLSAGLSNREIAEKLVVTVGTIKTHVHNIYTKLDVSSRTQAIVRARDLALV